MSQRTRASRSESDTSIQGSALVNPIFKYARTNNIPFLGLCYGLQLAVIEYARNSGFEYVKSWSDNRWSEGNVYRELGFVFESEKEKGASRGLEDGSVWPDYECVIRGKRISRHLAENMGLADLDLHKVYDCGKKRWSFKL